MMTNLILLDTASLIALLFVVLIGLPHGAFDGAIANHLGAGRSLAAGMKFIAIYCAVALLVIAIWLIAPGLTLTLFLIISMIHFGRGDAAAESQPALLIQILLHGGLPIFGIIYLQQDSVTPLFNALTDGSSDLALSLAEIIAPLMTTMTALYVLLAFRDPSLRPRLAEFILLAIAFAALPPLIGFAVYFCIIHTGRHMRRIWHMLSSSASPRGVFSQAAGFTIASWLVGAAVFFGIDSGNPEAELLKIIFIGLAALTVPHMILVDGFFPRTTVSKIARQPIRVKVTQQDDE